MMMQMGFNVSTELDSEVLIEKAKKVLWLSMNKMKQIAKETCPVKTGLLKRRIKLHPMQTGSEEYILADGVDYGIHVEYGTIKMRAQPFFRPAAMQVRFNWMPYYWSRELE